MYIYTNPHPSLSCHSARGQTLGGDDATIRRAREKKSPEPSLYMCVCLRDRYGIGKVEESNISALVDRQGKNTIAAGEGTREEIERYIEPHIYI